MMIHDMNSARAVAAAIAKKFGGVVRSVLLFGSAARGAGNDIDLVVVFSGESPFDSAQLDGLLAVRDEFPLLRMDLHPLWDGDLTSADDFTLHAQGSYLLPVLGEATILHGDNPFVGMRPTPTALAKDAVRKGAEYVMRARMAACGGGSTKCDLNSDPWRKNARKMLLDLLIASGDSVMTEGIVERAQALLPGHLSDGDAELLAPSDSPLEPRAAAAILERIIGMQRVIADSVGSGKKPMFRTVNGLACEVLLSDRARGEWVILCDGLPSVPQRHDLMRDLAARGFHVVHPRYAGTWESSGTFLEHSPTEDIVSVAEVIARGELGAESGPLTLVGSSFGGSVALCAAEACGAVRVVAFSPVTDFTAIAEEISSLGVHLREARSGAYRFTADGWARLSNGSLLDPGAERLPAATTIVAGTDDAQVPYNEISAYCANKSVRLVAKRDAGHISFTKVRERHWGDLLEALDA